MNCPLCNEAMRQLEAPRDREWICTNPEHGASKRHPDAHPDAYQPMFAMCRVCGELHQCGVLKQWWRCYLGSPEGLDELESHHFLSSSGDSNTICRLIDEVRRLRGWPMRFPQDES